MVGNVGRLASAVVFATILLIGASQSAYAVATLLLGGGMTGVIIWDTRRRIAACNQVRLSLTRVRQGWKNLGGGALWFWLMALSAALNQQGISLVLAAATSPAVVALYATHRTLANIPGYVFLLLQAPLSPELTQLWANGRKSDMSYLTFLALRATVCLTGTIALLIWVSAPVLFSRWTAGRLLLDPVLLLILLLQAVLSAAWSVTAWPVLTTNHHRGVSSWTLVNAVVSISLAAILARPYGHRGVAIASLTGDVLCGLIVFPTISARFLGVSVRTVIGHMSASAAGLLPLGLLAVIARRLWEGWPAVLAFSLSGLVISYPTLLLAIGKSNLARLLQLLPWRRANG
jgi:O-antigen/teichoic acid export membrane protein